MVVEADDRDIARHVPPGLAQGLDGADGDAVRPGEDGVEAGSALQESAHGPVTAELVPAGVDDPVIAHAPPEHAPVAADAIRRRRVPGGPHDADDVGPAGVHEGPCGERRPIDVVGVDAREDAPVRIPLELTAQDDGEPELAEPVQEPVPLVGGHDDDGIDGAPAGVLDDALPLGPGGRLQDHGQIGAVREPRDDPVAQARVGGVGEELLEGIGEEQRDGLGPADRERTAPAADDEPRLLDGAHHPIAGLLRALGGVVEHPGDGRWGHAGGAGDVGDGHALARGCHAPILPVRARIRIPLALRAVTALHLWNRFHSVVEPVPLPSGRS